MSGEREDEAMSPAGGSETGSRMDERFRLVARHAPVGIFLSNARGDCEFVNEAWCALAGMTPEEAMGGGWIRAIHPQDYERVMAGWEEAVRRGDPSTVEYRFRRRDGGVSWLQGSAVTVRDAAGGVTGYIGTVIDVTERRQAEQASRRLAAIVESSDDAIISKDLDGVVRSWNAGAQRLFGYTKEEMAGQSITRLIPADRRDEEPDIIVRIRGGERVEHYETTRQRKDGSMVEVSLTVSPIYDGEGRLVGASKIARDITERKRAERNARRQEKLYRAIGESIDYGIWVCDAQGRNIYASDSLLKLVGMTQEECSALGWSRVLAPEDIEDTLTAWAKCVETGGRWEREHRFKGVDGRWHPVLARGVPIRDEDGSIAHWAGINLDIAAIKETEAEVAAARDRAVAASRAKDEFLAALSHELRTPLNPVLLLASEAEADLSLPEHVRTDFATIRKNVELEARLIDDLLDLTRITRGKLSLNVAKQDIHVVLQDAVSTMQPELQQKGLKLELELNARMTSVWGDAVRLQQVLWNVLKNAVKFTLPGGTITVRTGVAIDGHWMFVDIVDTGIGMTRVELEGAFDAFSQGEHAAHGGSHRFGGVGLGLAISRMLVEMHRGTIEAHSAGRGQGSRFTLRLPVVAEDDGVEDQVPGQARRPAGVASAKSDLGPTKRRWRILLVEDHEPTRMALAQLLTRRNFDVVAAATLGEARTCASAGGIDFLVSDIGLPDGDGYELMAELSRRYKLRGVALTGYGMDHDVRRSESAGFQVHLTKPVTIQALDKALAGLVASREEGR